MNKRNLLKTGAGFALALIAIGCGGETANKNTVNTGNANLGAVVINNNTATAATNANPANSGAANSSAAGAVTVRVADITGSPEKYLGQTVTVEADLEEVLSPFAFELDEDSPVAGGIDNDLLVFSRKSANLASIDDQWLKNKVRVTGVVGRYSVAEVEREIGWDLSPKIEAELETVRPVIIAQSVERTGRN